MLAESGPGKDDGFVIMKFGGTSLGCASRILSVCQIVCDAFKEGPVVAVLSAISQKRKSTGTTSRLLELVECLGHGTDTSAELAKSILEDHMELIEGIFPDGKHKNNCKTAVIKLAKETLKYVEALTIINELSNASRDYVVSYGERMIATIFVELLVARGVSAVLLNINNVLGPFPEETAINQDYYDFCSQKIGEAIKACATGTLPVITGFFGRVPGGLLNIAGRGYTDFTASLAAVGVNAREIQIWKEVDGIFTADPSIAPYARFIEYTTPEEIEELTVYGSEVIHPLAMRQVVRKCIPITVKNFMKPLSKGTVILPGKPSSAQEKGIPIAVTLMDDIVLLILRPKLCENTAIFISKCIYTLDAYHIKVALISLSQNTATIAARKTKSLSDWRKATKELTEISELIIKDGMSIVTLVGSGLRSAVGSAAKLINAISEKGINIEMISQPAEQISISAVISTAKARDAVRAVHDNCILTQMAESTREKLLEI